MKCDVLVVGCSSAGLMAATSAAKGGAATVLLDRDLQGLSHTANTLFEGMAAPSGVKIESSYLIKELQGMRILSPSGHSVTIPAKGYFIDREKFDEHLLRQAESCGVELMQGNARMSELDSSRRTVSLEKDGIRLDDIEARVVVDASGIKAALARQAGLEPMRHPEDIAWALEAEIEHPGIGEETHFQYWIGSMAPGWKATFSPAAGDCATLGVFVRGHGQNVQPYFRQFLKMFKSCKSREYSGIEGLKILSVKRGGDPICVLPGAMAADSLLVTGGSAGQSGLAYSMRAGTICGMVAAEAVAAGDVAHGFLSRYEKLWKGEFYWKYRMGRASLQTLISMSDEEIDRLICGLSGKTLLACGSTLRKSVYAGAKVSLIRPGTMPDLLMNLARG
ncbi:Digeranylgeranylglycerophospholipid reductase [uncultured archaeon]|nr:Digeranylgeranylglycerophospholipid reductase [uncultured archaeon]